MRKGGNPKSGFNLDFEECSWDSDSTVTDMLSMASNGYNNVTLSVHGLIFVDFRDVHGHP